MSKLDKESAIQAAQFITEKYQLHVMNLAMELSPYIQRGDGVHYPISEEQSEYVIIPCSDTALRIAIAFGMEYQKRIDKI